ncbi:MAG: CTP synthase [Candidatus Niyogibacteria bacterium RIFCSPLOWO2_12_FULL_41_13]|uniref:CTP synthase n=1 Tax=Candidatus Niyogibacteria bacterium RIFCSPLOWO2_12_FULL_41_13 TaxID=1801726 RepID=A0A1G2F3M0_9BACT|nr:MAG: CTP synthase [Candidatus Niyogibacteria bacterium RIFCSPLOWO2_12_FULL_41_13]
MTKYIFVIGGVMSGIGKGITTASIGRILLDKGFNATAVKIDPYINIDAGTMNPVEHGEVFVTEDGDETDQDIGNYERFLDKNILSENYMTTGRVYQAVINKERNLEYGGRCVEVVPDIPNEVIRRIYKVVRDSRADFVLVEIGGTAGEYQNLLFLEAARIMKLRHPKDVLFVLVSYLPVPRLLGEMKTKPTQYAVRTLNSAGIQPDIIIARSESPIDEPRKRKIGLFCNVVKEDIISAPDVESIYEVPLNFEKENLSRRILSKFNLRTRKKDSRKWNDLARKIKNLKKSVKIGIVGKYFKIGKFTLMDSYISIIEAIKHAAYFCNAKPEIVWLDAEDYEKGENKLKELKSYDGIIVPGGFGGRGSEGKIKAIGYCRRNKIPFLGLCYGMQLAAIEFARNVSGLKKAHTTEVDKNTPHPVIDLMLEQKKNLAGNKYGGTMRLGAYKCALKPGAISHKAYGEKEISERHRHRYELNNKYREVLEKKGLVVAGVNPERDLVEIIELPVKKHPFFVGVQFHPEFKSKPLRPHPLFREFIKASIKTNNRHTMSVLIP